MGRSGNGDLTQLIVASGAGDRGAQDQLFAIVFDELRNIARRSRFVGGAGQTLQPTALVNEAYLVLSGRLQLARPESASLRDAFYTTVARAMRTILRDHWRAQHAEKRGGGQRAAALTNSTPAAAAPSEFDAVDFLALDGALTRLESFNPRWFTVVMHRYFAGREIDETAELMNISRSTVKSDWQLARAWLYRQIEQGSE
ncbi:sigma-70 family RNA polymerase sigma factor [soil metagenome]